MDSEKSDARPGASLCIEAEKVEDQVVAFAILLTPRLASGMNEIVVCAPGMTLKFAGS
jgi:hypothetical protein